MSDRERIEAALQLVEEACDSLSALPMQEWKWLSSDSCNSLISAATTLMLELDRHHQINMTGPYQREEMRADISYAEMMQRINDGIKPMSEAFKKFAEAFNNRDDIDQLRRMYEQRVIPPRPIRAEPWLRPRNEGGMGL